jgi:hypothetical protein
MAGILELLGASTGDAGKDAAINNGILQAGLSLLQSRGRLGPALGQAGMAGLQGFQQAQQHTFQQQLQQSQLEELKRRQAMQQLPAQFARTPAQTALANGGGPTVANARVAESAQPSFDYQGYANSLAQYDPVAALQLKESLKPKEKAPIKLGAGDTLVDPATFKQIASAPEKEPEALRTLRIIYGENSPQFQKAAQQLAQKMTTHQPAVTVANYGSPVPVQLPDGSTALVQPSNRAGSPPQLMTLPGSSTPLRPAKDPQQKDLTEAQAKATAFLGQMQSASKELEAVGFDSSALSNQAETALAGGVANIAIGQKAQRVRQAQDQWSEAFLRFKTGAASTPAEVKANRETFFPKIGDKPENIEQKKRMRQQAEADMAIAAGRGASQLTPKAPAQRQIKRTGTANGRKVVEYSDGSIEYAD